MVCFSTIVPAAAALPTHVAKTQVAKKITKTTAKILMLKKNKKKRRCVIGVRKGSCGKQ